MKLSILLICYNQEKYINQCIDSILFQNIPFDYEIVVADDCSEDSTLTIIKEKLDASGNHLKILENKINLGISKNYQRGFSACTGDYIAVMEGDDYWTSPERLLMHINFLEKHRECVMSMNRYIEFDESLNSMKHIGWHLVEDFKYVTTRDMANGNKLGNLSACVFRKKEISKIKLDFYRLDVADWILGLVLSQNGFIAILKELTSVRRVHENGEWSKMSSKNKNETLITCIDNYNKYLEYKYDKEFTAYKSKINSTVTLSFSNYPITGFIPPIIIYLCRLIIPKNCIVFIKKWIKK
ncbi:glycosyltransferase family 2 protein [Flavobacterium sp. LB2P44]|uniref:glycosyltransferase family 2 protein n=1 Tax=Flavobacterium sp. LB2P44 TaxID=3401713 RepID=UPI003AAC69EE